MSPKTKSVSGGKSAGSVARDELRVGQKAQIARNRILLEVVNALAELLEREPEREAGTQRIAVGLHVAHHHECRTAAQFCGDLGGGADARRALDHPAFSSAGTLWRSASSRSVLASAMARSVERSSMKIRSGVWRKSILCPSSPRKKSAGVRQRVERLAGLMPVADHRDVHFAVLKIVARSRRALPLRTIDAGPRALA